MKASERIIPNKQIFKYPLIPKKCNDSQRTNRAALENPLANDPYRLKASLIVNSNRCRLTVVSKAGKV